MEVNVFGFTNEFQDIFNQSPFPKGINMKVLFGKYFQKFKTILTATRDDWYGYLHNNVLMEYPIMMEDTVGLNIPKKGSYQ